MKTYVINLPHRRDRIQDLEIPTEISDGYEIFEATNGVMEFDFEPNRRMRGHMGCWDSHRRLLEKIGHENNGSTLVLEDDCQFIASDLQRYLQELPEDWDLLYLGGINQDMPEAFSNNLDYARNILQTHAYVVNDKFVPTLLQVLTHHRWKVDIVFSEAIKRGKCFICNPPLAIQSESQSDINRH